MSVLKYNNNGTWEGLNIDHASTADSALYDGNGDQIDTTYAKATALGLYLPLTAGNGAPLTGDLYLEKNGTPVGFIHGTTAGISINATNSNGDYVAGMLANNANTIVYAAGQNISFRPYGWDSTGVEAYMGTGGRLVFSSDNSHYGGIDRTANGTTVSYLRQTYSGYLDIWSTQATQIRVGAGNQESNTVRFLFGSNGVLTAPGMYTQTGSGSTLTIASDGQIKRSSSLRKYKKNIEDVTEEQANNGYGLRPITFESAIEGDREERQYGLIAEEVEEVVPELCTYDMDGNIDGVAYDRVCAILLKQNQMLKARVDALEKRVEELERK